MTGKIVVATYGSGIGNRAVDFAAALSEKFGEDLCVVHVLMHARPSREYERMAEIEGLVLPPVSDNAVIKSAFPMQFMSAADEMATAKVISAIGDQIASRAKQRAQDAGACNVTTHICLGDVADEILDVAEAEKAGMLVLGRRGLGVCAKPCLAVSRKKCCTTRLAPSLS